MVTAVVSLLLLLAGHPMVINFIGTVLPQVLVDAIASLSIWTHFESIRKGVIDLRDIVYFALMIGFWVYASAVVIDHKKAD